MHIYTRELLDKHLLPELKEIAQSLGIVPDDNKTRRETWVSALIGQSFPLFQSIALEDETVAGNTEPVAIFTGEGPPNRGDGRGGRIENFLNADVQESIESAENLLDADRVQESIEPAENIPGVDRTPEPIELSDLESALAEIVRLRTQNEKLLELARSQSDTIRRAKDISPVERPSFKRVFALAQEALLSISKSMEGGWTLSMGPLKRNFKKLRHIWDLLIAENWYLMDLFCPPPPPVVAKPIFAPVHSRYSAIPFCDDDLIDIWSLGINAVSGGRAPPAGGDAM